MVNNGLQQQQRGHYGGALGVRLHPLSHANPYMKNSLSNKRSARGGAYGGRAAPWRQAHTNANNVNGGAEQMASLSAASSTASLSQYQTWLHDQHLQLSASTASLYHHQQQPTSAAVASSAYALPPMDAAPPLPSPSLSSGRLPSSRAESSFSDVSDREPILTFQGSQALLRGMSGVNNAATDPQQRNMSKATSLGAFKQGTSRAALHDEDTRMHLMVKWEKEMHARDAKESEFSGFDAADGGGRNDAASGANTNTDAEADVNADGHGDGDDFAYTMPPLTLRHDELPSTASLHGVHGVHGNGNLSSSSSSSGRMHVAYPQSKATASTVSLLSPLTFETAAPVRNGRKNKNQSQKTLATKSSATNISGGDGSTIASGGDGGGHHDSGADGAASTNGVDNEHNKRVDIDADYDSDDDDDDDRDVVLLQYRYDGDANANGGGGGDGTRALGAKDEAPRSRWHPTESTALASSFSLAALADEEDDSEGLAHTAIMNARASEFKPITLGGGARSGPHAMLHVRMTDTPSPTNDDVMFNLNANNNNNNVDDANSHSHDADALSVQSDAGDGDGDDSDDNNADERMIVVYETAGNDDGVTSDERLQPGRQRLNDIERSVNIVRKKAQVQDLRFFTERASVHAVLNNATDGISDEERLAATQRKVYLHSNRMRALRRQLARLREQWLHQQRVNRRDEAMIRAELAADEESAQKAHVVAQAAFARDRIVRTERLVLSYEQLQAKQIVATRKASNAAASASVSASGGIDGANNASAGGADALHDEVLRRYAAQDEDATLDLPAEIATVVAALNDEEMARRSATTTRHYRLDYEYADGYSHELIYRNREEYERLIAEQNDELRKLLDHTALEEMVVLKTLNHRNALDVVYAAAGRHRVSPHDAAATSVASTAIATEGGGDTAVVGVGFGSGSKSKSKSMENSDLWRQVLSENPHAAEANLRFLRQLDAPDERKTVTGIFDRAVSGYSLVSKGAARNTGGNANANANAGESAAGAASASNEATSLASGSTLVIVDASSGDDSDGDGDETALTGADASAGAGVTSRATMQRFRACFEGALGAQIPAARKARMRRRNDQRQLADATQAWLDRRRDVVSEEVRVCAETFEANEASDADSSDDDEDADQKQMLMRRNGLLLRKTYERDVKQSEAAKQHTRSVGAPVEGKKDVLNERTLLNSLLRLYYDMTARLDDLTFYTVRMSRGDLSQTNDGFASLIQSIEETREAVTLCFDRNAHKLEKWQGLEEELEQRTFEADVKKARRGSNSDKRLSVDNVAKQEFEFEESRNVALAMLRDKAFKRLVKYRSAVLAHELKLEKTIFAFAHEHEIDLNGTASDDVVVPDEVYRLLGIDKGSVHLPPDFTRSRLETGDDIQLRVNFSFKSESQAAEDPYCQPVAVLSVLHPAPQSSAAEDKSESDKTAVVPKTFDMRIACSELKSGDLLSESDPCCAVYIKDTADGVFYIAGKTETLSNDNDPEFEQTVAVTVPTGASVKFVVYDNDEGEQLNAGDVVGKLVVPFEEMRSQHLTAPLVSAEGGKANDGAAEISITIEETTPTPAVEASADDDEDENENLCTSTTIGATGVRPAAHTRQHRHHLQTHSFALPLALQYRYVPKQLLSYCKALQNDNEPLHAALRGVNVEADVDFKYLEAYLHAVYFPQGLLCVVNADINDEHAHWRTRLRHRERENKHFHHLTDGGEEVHVSLSYRDLYVLVGVGGGMQQTVQILEGLEKRMYTRLVAFIERMQAVGEAKQRLLAALQRQESLGLPQDDGDKSSAAEDAEPTHEFRFPYPTMNDLVRAVAEERLELEQSLSSTSAMKSEPVYELCVYNGAGNSVDVDSETGVETVTYGPVLGRVRFDANTLLFATPLVREPADVDLSPLVALLKTSTLMRADKRAWVLQMRKVDINERFRAHHSNYVCALDDETSYVEMMQKKANMLNATAAAAGASNSGVVSEPVVTTTMSATSLTASWALPTPAVETESAPQVHVHTGATLTRADLRSLVAASGGMERCLALLTMLQEKHVHLLHITRARANIAYLLEVLDTLDEENASDYTKEGSKTRSNRTLVHAEVTHMLTTLRAELDSRAAQLKLVDEADAKRLCQNHGFVTRADKEAFHYNSVFGDVFETFEPLENYTFESVVELQECLARLTRQEIAKENTIVLPMLSPHHSLIENEVNVSQFTFEFSVQNLSQGGFSALDPVLTLQMKTSEGVYEDVGSTEHLLRNDNPTFERLIQVECSHDAELMIAIRNSNADGEPIESEVLGSAFVRLSELGMNAGSETRCTLPLMDGDANAVSDGQGCVSMTIVELEREVKVRAKYYDGLTASVEIVRTTDAPLSRIPAVHPSYATKGASTYAMSATPLLDVLAGYGSDTVHKFVHPVSVLEQTHARARNAVVLDEISALRVYQAQRRLRVDEQHTKQRNELLSELNRKARSQRGGDYKMDDGVQLFAGEPKPTAPTAEKSELMRARIGKIIANYSDSRGKGIVAFDDMLTGRAQRELIFAQRTREHLVQAPHRPSPMTNDEIAATAKKTLMKKPTPPPSKETLKEPTPPPPKEKVKSPKSKKKKQSKREKSRKEKTPKASKKSKSPASKTAGGETDLRVPFQQLTVIATPEKDDEAQTRSSRGSDEADAGAEDDGDEVAPLTASVSVASTPASQSSRWDLQSRQSSGEGPRLMSEELSNGKSLPLSLSIPADNDDDNATEIDAQSIVKHLRGGSNGAPPSIFSPVRAGGNGGPSIFSPVRVESGVFPTDHLSSASNASRDSNNGSNNGSMNRESRDYVDVTFKTDSMKKMSRKQQASLQPSGHNSRHNPTFGMFNTSGRSNQEYSQVPEHLSSKRPKMFDDFTSIEGHLAWLEEKKKVAVAEEAYLQAAELKKEISQLQAKLQQRTMSIPEHHDSDGVAELPPGRRERRSSIVDTIEREREWEERMGLYVADEPKKKKHNVSKRAHSRTSSALLEARQQFPGSMSRGSDDYSDDDDDDDDDDNFLADVMARQATFRRTSIGQT
jgi:hypothetical protein